jgi:hypothetical protein
LNKKVRDRGVSDFDASAGDSPKQTAAAEVRMTTPHNMTRTDDMAQSPVEIPMVQVMKTLPSAKSVKSAGPVTPMLDGAQSGEAAVKSPRREKRIGHAARGESKQKSRGRHGIPLSTTKLKNYR